MLGREVELEQLRGAADAARGGQGRLVLVTGDAGIGKTTLMEAFAADAERDGGMTIARARCWDGGGSPAYWLWTQALGGWARRTPAAGRIAVGPGGAHLLRLVAELADHVDAPPAEAAGTDGDRFALYDAVLRLLEGIGSRRPLLLLMDDLHAADPSSLLMLRMVARELASLKVLIVAAYRDAEAAAEPELAALAREGTRLALAGLPRHAAEALVEAVTPSPQAGLVDALLDTTHGNPLYLFELCLLLERQGRLTPVGVRQGGAVPATVSAVVSRRLDVLPDEHRATLRVASVMGREWGVRPVAGLLRVPDEAVMAAVAEGARAGLVQPSREHAGATFSHAIVRDALYQEIPYAERPQMHRRAAEALLEGRAGSDGAEHLSAIAHHLLAAQDRRGIDFSIRAGEQADSVLAHEDAAEHYARALAALDDAGQDESRKRCHVLLLLGAAQWRAALAGEARTSFLRAGAVARAAGLAPELARAALGPGGRYAWVEATGERDDLLVTLLEDALAAQPEADSPLKAEVMARLAMLLYYAPDQREQREALSARAIEIARRADDGPALAYALNARRFVLWHSPPRAERLQVATELLALARAHGEPELALRGHAWRIVDLLEDGDAAGAAAAAGEHAALSERLRQPLFLAESAKWRAMQALMRGQLGEAERLTQEFAALAERAEHRDVYQALAVHTFVLRFLQGRLDELVGGIGVMADQFPRIAAWRGALAFALMTLGRRDAARSELARVAATGFDLEDQAGSRAVGLALLSEVCAAVGDAACATELAQLLEPHDGRCIVVAYAAAVFGPAARPLGLLDAARGDSNRAVDRLRAAVDMNQRMGARPWTAIARADLARVLARRGEAGDEDEAHGLVADAARAAQAMEADGLEARVAEVAAEIGLESRVTFLFSDIVDSTTTAARLGDRPWLELLRQHNAVVRRAIRLHGGDEVKTIGDGFMVAFRDTRDAIGCAEATQRELAASGAEPLRLRIGIHAGAALREDRDWFGSDVNFAARVAAQAAAGEILVSDAALAQAGRPPVRAERVVVLKGFAGEHRVHLLEWTSDPPEPGARDRWSGV